MSEKAKLIAAYLYDEEGYYNGSTLWQLCQETGEYLKVENSTETAPKTKEGYFSKWDEQTGEWGLEKAPTAAELVGKKISNAPDTLHDLELLAIVRAASPEDFSYQQDSGEVWLEAVEKVEETLEDVKARRLEELDNAFIDFRNNGALVTINGVEVDATERALQDVGGLVKVTGPSEKVGFMCADNVPREFTGAFLRELEKILIKNGHDGYRQKWALRDAINAAKSIDDVNAIKIEFLNRTNVNF